MVTVLLLVLIAALSYTLGCLNGSLIISRRMFGVDIRSMGSGNAGATNFFRSFCRSGLLEVLAVDIGKGLLAAFLGVGVLVGVFGGSSAIRNYLKV